METPAKRVGGKLVEFRNRIPAERKRGFWSLLQIAKKETWDEDVSFNQVIF
jgi:hypothetical protein